MSLARGPIRHKRVPGVAGHPQSRDDAWPAQDEVVDILVGSLQLEALLGLEPLFDLVGALARDLQSEFVPAVPRVLCALSDLVETGAPALDGHPTSLLA